MKKWMQCAVSVALACCLVFGLTACKEEDAPGESAESQFLDDAVHALVQEDYVTADFTVSMKQSTEYGDEETETSVKMRFAKNEQYGFDYSLVESYEGGYANETLVVDGVQYSARQTSDGRVLYDAYPAGTGMAQGVEVISELISSQDVFGIVDSLFSMTGLDDISGIETDSSQDEMTVRAELEELKSGLLAYLEGLKKNSLDGLKETVNGLLDWEDTVLLLGAGPTGLCTLQCVLLHRPGRVIVCEPQPQRARFVREHHPSVEVVTPQECLSFVRERCERGGADVVIEAAGAGESFRLAWECARPNAIVTVVALYDRPQMLPLPEMYGKNLTFKTGGVDGCDCAEILRLIGEGRIDTTPLITHRYPLAAINEAYRLFEAREEGVIKVAIHP